MFRRLFTFMVVITIMAVAFSAAPATAAVIPNHNRIVHAITGRCLIADYASIYTIEARGGCPTNQVWSAYHRGVDPNGTVVFIDHATNQCMANLDYYRVYMISCTSGYVGITWYLNVISSTSFYLRNVNTGRWLSSDYSGSVYLADYVPNQNWSSL